MESLFDNWPVIAILGTFITWMYKVQNDQIKRMREDFIKLEAKYEQLENKFDVLKKSESKWYKISQWLIGLILRNKQCKNGSECSVYKEFSQDAEKNGIL